MFTQAKVRHVVSMLLGASLLSCSGDGQVVDSPLSFGERQAIASACGARPAEIVIIDDFAYSPLNITVNVGDTVAWVNQEKCGDNALEDVASMADGCDSHHQVVTFPVIPGQDAVGSGPICSPFPGLAGAAGGDVPSNCQDEGGSNVFCHTFRQPGMQHYTCFTNPGHTATLNGFVDVQP